MIDRCPSRACMRLPLPSGPARVEKSLKGGSTMLFVGIDWSDRSLDFHLRAADGRVLAQGQVKPSVEGLAELFTAGTSIGRSEEAAPVFRRLIVRCWTVSSWRRARFSMIKLLRPTNKPRNRRNSTLQMLILTNSS